jgi:hypothetical protein
LADWNVTDAQCVPNKPPPASTKFFNAVASASPILFGPNGSKQVLIMPTPPNWLKLAALRSAGSTLCLVS